MVVEYIRNQEFGYEIIAPINQVRIYKRMMLPYELVGFQGSNKTKEAREYEKKELCYMEIWF